MEALATPLLFLAEMARAVSAADMVGCVWWAIWQTNTCVRGWWQEMTTGGANTATMKQRLTVQSIRLEGPDVVRASPSMEKDLPETMLHHAPHTNTCKNTFFQLRE